MKVRAFNIQWDTDGEDIDLPKEMIVDVDEDHFNDDPDEAVGDAVSDESGFCHNGLSYEIVQE